MFNRKTKNTKSLESLLSKDINMSLSDDVDVEFARANYKEYLNDLKEEQRKYIKTLCHEIKTSSRQGSQSVITVNSSNKIMTYEFMAEIKEYFEQRGFRTREESGILGNSIYWLRIMWD